MVSLYMDHYIWKNGCREWTDGEHQALGGGVKLGKAKQKYGKGIMMPLEGFQEWKSWHRVNGEWLPSLTKDWYHDERVGDGFLTGKYKFPSVSLDIKFPPQIRRNS
jgi:hypothetical protein